MTVEPSSSRESVARGKFFSKYRVSTALVSAHVCNAGKSTFMLPQNWNNMQATLQEPFFSQVHMISGSRRSSNLPGLPLGKTQNTRTQWENLAGGTDKYVCSSDNTADSSTEEIARNAVPNKSPTLLLIGFPTSAHLKYHHFAPGNTTHQTQDKAFVGTLDNVDLFIMVTVLALT